MRYCCPLCSGMEAVFLTRIPPDYDEEMLNCEVEDNDDD